jgi:hypothetical protein
MQLCSSLCDLECLIGTVTERVAVNLDAWASAILNVALRPALHGQADCDKDQRLDAHGHYAKLPLMK